MGQLPLTASFRGYRLDEGCIDLSPAYVKLSKLYLISDPNPDLNPDRLINFSEINMQ